MCYNVFTKKINLFKCGGFKDGRYTYKNTGSSHHNIFLSFKSIIIDKS